MRRVAVMGRSSSRGAAGRKMGRSMGGEEQQGRSSRGGASGGERGRSTGPASLQHTQVASTTAGCIVEGGCTTTTLHASASIDLVAAAWGAGGEGRGSHFFLFFLVENGKIGEGSLSNFLFF